MLVEFHSFDRNYLQRLRCGDASTEKHFADYFSRIIRLKVGTRLRSKAAIDDIRQETFLRVWVALRKEGGIRQPERFGAFVSSVCKNILREQHRKAVKDDRTLDDSAASLSDISIGTPDIIASLESRRQIGLVLAKLPAKPRNLIHKLFLEECDRGEVCLALRVNRPYLRVLVHRATRQFKKHYLDQTNAELGRRPAKLHSRVSSQESRS